MSFERVQLLSGDPIGFDSSATGSEERTHIVDEGTGNRGR